MENFWYHYRKSLPFWQFPRSEKTVPSGQTHATERVGSVSLTIHLCSPLQGLLSLQGFWQRSPIHAKLVWQSWSTLHSGSGVLGTIKSKACCGTWNLQSFYSKNRFGISILLRINIMLTFSTRNVSISLKRIVAGTYFPVIICSTGSSRSTWISPTQRLTFFSCWRWRKIITFFIVRAFIARRTSSLGARNQWVTLQAWRTFTNSSMWFRFTNCSTATNDVKTWILAFIALAIFWIWTVVIDLTFV